MWSVMNQFINFVELQRFLNTYAIMNQYIMAILERICTILSFLMPNAGIRFTWFNIGFNNFPLFVTKCACRGI